MITFNELKTFLLKTQLFIDNEYLNKYINLIVDSGSSARAEYTEKHHVLPVSYYR